MAPQQLKKNGLSELMIKQEYVPNNISSKILRLYLLLENISEAHATALKVSTESSTGVFDGNRLRIKIFRGVIFDKQFFCYAAKSDGFWRRIFGLDDERPIAELEGGVISWLLRKHIGPLPIRHYYGFGMENQIKTIFATNRYLQSISSDMNFCERNFEIFQLDSLVEKLEPQRGEIIESPFRSR